MFCSNCGKQLPDDCTFCGQCGTPVEKEPVQPVEENVQTPAEEITLAENQTEQPIAEVPPVEEAAQEAPVAEAQNAFAQFNAPAAQPRKKSKKKLIGWLSAVTAVLVAGAVAIGAFWKPIQGAWIENFGSDEEYLSYVEQNSTEKLTDTLSSSYGSVAEALTADPANGAFEMNMKLTVGNKLITLVEDVIWQETGEKLDMGWLNSIDLDMKGNIKDSLEQVGMTLNIGETEIAKLDMILNMDKGETFLGILSLSDKYLKVDMDMAAQGGMAASEYSEMMELLTSEELQKALPTEKEMDALLDKYIGIVLENLDDVEKSAEVVKSAGVTQKLTTLETEIDQEDALRIATAVLKTARDDTQIKKIINNMAKFLEENDLIEDADGVYDDFRDSIDEALEAVEDAEPEGDSEIILTDYVNDDHEIVGRRIEVDGQEILYYVEVREGNKLAFELEMGNVQIYGEGTEKNGVVNAEYTLWAGDVEICDIILVDFKAKDESLNGKIRIAPSSEMMERMGLDTVGASALALADPQLELGFETGKNSAKVEINLISGDEVLLGIALTSKETKATGVTLPDDKDVYDQDEAEQWLQEMDVNDLLEKLEDATGLPITGLLQGQAYPDTSNSSQVIF